MHLSRFVHVAVGAILLASSSFARPAEPENAGVSIWTQNVDNFRKESGLAGGYTKRWDLGDLPHYAPMRKLSGTLRFWGNNYLKDGKLSQYWEEGFRKFQPDLKIEYVLPTAAISVMALVCGVSDIGMNNKATLTDLLTFEQMFHYPVSEVIAATGSYDVYGWTPPHIIVVHKDNPLDKISMKQLDGVFGAARSGGYVGSVWHTEYPYSRGAEENIRTWGQLGLTGEWADKPIRIGGQNLLAGATLTFGQKVVKGSGQFAEGYRTFANYIMPGGRVNSWSKQAQRAFSEDRYAMYYISPLSLSPEMKELAIQAEAGGPYVKRTLESVHERTYPLVQEQRFYFNHKPGEPLDPKVEEFIRYVLSQEGQGEVQREGRYLPLTAEVVRAQLMKLQ